MSLSKALEELATWTNNDPQDDMVLIVDGAVATIKRIIVRAEVAEEKVSDLRKKVQDVLDLARTGSAPSSFNMTEEMWLHHKINKIAAELQDIVKEK